MNRINEIDNTIEGKETKTYYQDHPELVVLSGRLYGKVTYAEYFDAYYLQFGDNVYYFPQKDSYQEGRNWKKKKFDSYEECLNFSQQHNIKIVMKSTVKSPFSNGLPDPRFLFPKRNTPYNPSERVDVSRIRENKHNTNMNKKLIRLTESDLHRIVKESVNRILNEVKYGLENAYRYKGYRMLKGGVVIDPNGKEIGKVDNPDEFGRMVNDHLSMRADDIENGREKLPPSQPAISYGTMEDDGDYRRYDMARRLRDRAYPPFERHQITQIR